MKPLTELFHQHGTDKGWFHGYGPTYDALLHDRRTTVRRVLELGVRDGSSLLAWRDYFPHAAVWGVDIATLPESVMVNLAAIRIFLVHGDATDPEVHRQLTQSAPYDLIVDDASHEIADQLASLLGLWPALARGGLYVIEDHLEAAHLYTLAKLPGAIVSDFDPDKGGSLVVVRKP